MPIVLQSGSLNHLELSGPVQGCTGIALPLYMCIYIYIYIYISWCCPKWGQRYPFRVLVSAVRRPPHPPAVLNAQPNHHSLENTQKFKRITIRTMSSGYVETLLLKALCPFTAVCNVIMYCVCRCKTQVLRVVTTRRRMADCSCNDAT